MKRLIYATLIVLAVCFIGSMSVLADEDPKPKLHIVEIGNWGELGSGRYLADEDGNLLYSLAPPHVSIDVRKKRFIIHSHVYYAPGTDYYNSFYDGFNVICGSHPRSGVEPLRFEFGHDGGRLFIPGKPYEVCLFQAFVVDSEGTIFTTEPNIIHFSRGK